MWDEGLGGEGWEIGGEKWGGFGLIQCEEEVRDEVVGSRKGG